MASTVQIKVYGKTYAVKRASKQINLEELAGYVDAKMQELSYASAKTSTIDLAILTALNIAQELMELKSEVNAERKEAEAKTEAMIDRLVEALDEKKQDR